MKPLRVSAISYLNTAPLMWDFEHGLAPAEFEVSYTIPSQCAAHLQDGSAAIGIIPAAAYTTIPDLLILPEIAIASRGAVRSILLVSKVALEKIRTVALDSSSLTSVALLRVLFAKWWGEGQSFTPMAPDLQRMLGGHDAGLLIGDSALRIDRRQYITYDLAEEWIRLTGQPFVFAFWAVRRDALRHIGANLDLVAVFQQSRDHGLQPDKINQIAAAWAGRLGMSQSDIRRYLTENIHYYLDPECIAGMRLFFQYASECGVLPPISKLRFLEHKTALL